MKSSDVKKGVRVKDLNRPGNGVGVGVISAVRRTVLRVKYDGCTLQYNIGEALSGLEVQNGLVRQ